MQCMLRIPRVLSGWPVVVGSCLQGLLHLFCVMCCWWWFLCSMHHAGRFTHVGLGRVWRKEQTLVQGA
jgi:hypothetical protein